MNVIGKLQERSYAVVADTDSKIVVCRASGAGIGLLNAMLNIAVQQSFIYAKPVMVTEDDQPFRIVSVTIPPSKPRKK